jgi:tetratricopeptide (TPR) repeat protein
MIPWLLLTSLLAQPVDPAYAAAELERALAGDPTPLFERLRLDAHGALAGLDAALRAEPPALDRARRLADSFQKLVGTGALRSRVEWFVKLGDADRARWRALAQAGPAADAAAELERLGDPRGAAWAALAGASDPEKLRGLAGTFEFLWDGEGRCRAFTRLAEVLLARGDAEGALAAAENAVKVAEESESVKDGPARRARAAVHRAAGRFAEAALDLKAAAHPRAWPEGSEAPALVEIEMAEAHAERGDTPGAWEIYKGLVARAGSLPVVARGRVHGSLARFHSQTPQVAEAEAEAGRALAVREDDVEALLLRARAALALGRREAAARDARRALDAKKRSPAQIVTALRLLGRATREDIAFQEALAMLADDALLLDRARTALERGDAEAALRQAEAQAHDAGPLAAGAALALAAEAAQRLGKREEARTRAREALERWERLPPERLVLGEPDGPDPERLARRLFDLTDDPEAAWLIAQKAAAWRMLAGVAHIRFERAYRMRPAMTEMRKMVLEGERYWLRLLETEVTFQPGKPGLPEPGAAPGMAALFAPRGTRPLALPVPFPSAEVRGSLPEGALVAFAAGIETSRVFLFTKERFVSAPLGLAPGALARLSAEARSRAGAPAEALARGRRWFDQLLGGVAPLPEGTLRFAPCVELLGFPFEALVPPGGDRAAPARLADVPFLGRDRAIAYLPAAGWAARGAAPAPAGRTGIVADALASMDGQPVTIYGVTWTREETARAEVDALVEALGGARVGPAETRARGERFEVALGKDAKEDLFKGSMDLGGMQALHVQGQAWWNADDWAMNGIGLAQAEAQENDGLLFAWEIVNLGLEGRMVTLSASRDSILAPPGNEGVLALPRAFLLGGASALVLPSLPVEAATRRRFFARFHAERAAGKAAPEAARLARQALLASDDPPADWAGIAVWGR